MLLEYAENIVQLLACLAALLMLLFRYIGRKRRDLLYAVIFFLFYLLSCYYWTAYLLIMGESPNVSALLTYFGWNVAYVMMLALVLHGKSREERRYFHPAMLVPIPLNIWQLTLYIPYGAVNSIYQVTICTATACAGIQSICWYVKKRGIGLKPPLVAVASLLFTCFEFGMWTSTCFDRPVADLYYPFSFLCSASLLFLTWCLLRINPVPPAREQDPMDRKIQRIMKLNYLALVLLCCVGGILLGVWMRNTMAAGIPEPSETGMYNVIPVVLFIISLFLVAFAVVIIFVVNFRAKAVENGKLREARRVAEHSNAVKSDFLANMSHEIRTPINAVLGMNEIILRESMQARNDPPEDREKVKEVFGDICRYAGDVESAGNSLLSIVNDILDISRIEAGKLEITEAEYSLSSVVNDVSTLVMFRARAKGLDFRIDVAEDIPDALFGDGLRVRQIMTNLLSNAVKYTDRGSIRMTVGRDGAETPAAGQMMNLVVSVQDTGIGIRQEDQDRLFIKFERVELKRNSTVEGSGLGLAITRNLLDMMGGSISVKSVYGEGSTFTVAIPQRVVSCEPVGDYRKKAEQNMPAADAQAGIRRTLYAPDVRMLAVDDTRLNITVIEGLLKDSGIRIDAAVSGAEAVKMARANAYDIILMDQRMPVMDGMEALRLIRAQENSPNLETPVISLTADAVSGAKERYLAEGFTDYLTKPVSGGALEAMLKNYLAADKLRHSVPENEIRTEPRKEPETGESGGFAPRIPGVSAETGLQYCRQDEALYRTILKDYVQSSAEKAAEIRKYYGAEDWKNYGILVHALKSTSRMIGAEELANEAAEMEKAAKAEDARAVRGGHEAMMNRYAALAEAIGQALDIRPEPPETEEDIFEFLPEEKREGE